MKTRSDTEEESEDFPIPGYRYQSCGEFIHRVMSNGGGYILEESRPSIQDIFMNTYSENLEKR